MIRRNWFLTAWLIIAVLALWGVAGTKEIDAQQTGQIVCGQPDYYCMQGRSPPQLPVTCKKVLQKQTAKEKKKNTNPPWPTPTETYTVQYCDDSYPCTECSESGTIYPYPERPEGGHGGNACPTKIAGGQLDGTGTGLYTSTDYSNPSYQTATESLSTIEVEPFYIEGGGADDVAGIGPRIDPVDDDFSPVADTGTPCGWPILEQDTRRVTAGCADGTIPDTADKDCTGDACKHQHAGNFYDAIDVGTGKLGSNQPGVYSTQDGTMYRCSAADYGYYVIVTGSDYNTLYAHLSKEPGDTGETSCPNVDNKACLRNDCLITTREVRRGEAVGITGNSGTSTGPHLHYEIRQGGLGTDKRVCPADFMDYDNSACQVINSRRGGTEDVGLLSAFLRAVSPL